MLIIVTYLHNVSKKKKKKRLKVSLLKTKKFKDKLFEIKAKTKDNIGLTNSK